jgi:DivIVA domain-containing protein
MSAPEFLGFNLVRRGYDRRQVDAYLDTLSALPPGTPPPGPPVFDIVRRGYDPGQVDARVSELRGG